MSRRPHHATVISLVALFVALGGTSYAAISISGKNVKNGSLSGADVKNSSLTGKDVKNNSLTGSDVAESKLGKVKAAKAADHAKGADSATTAGNAAALGGQPASAFANQSSISRPFAANCSPADANFVGCGSTSVTLPRSGRLVMFGELFYGGSDAAPEGASGRCRYLLNGVSAAESPILTAPTGKGTTAGAPFNAQTNPLPAGTYNVGLQCNSTNPGMVYAPARVTVLTVSPN